MPSTKSLPAISRAVVFGLTVCATTANALAECVDRKETEKQVLAQVAESARRLTLMVPKVLQSFESATLSLTSAGLADPHTGKLRSGGFRLINSDTGGAIEVSEQNRTFFTDPQNKDTLVVPTNPSQILVAKGKPLLQKPAATAGGKFPWGGAGMLIAPYANLLDNVPSKFNGDDNLAPTKLAPPPPASSPSPPNPPPPKLPDNVVAILKVRIDGAVERCNGIQVLPGRVATALHCTDNASKLYVYFGDLKRVVGADGNPVTAPVDFSGAYRCDAKREFPAETDAQLAQGALDFALLRVPNADLLPEFNRAYTPFGSPTTFDGAVEAELPLAWVSPDKESNCGYLGKCSDTSNACRIHKFLRAPPATNVSGCGLGEPYGAKDRDDKIYIKDGLTHSCDTHNSNSGAALLSRDRSRVLAIHMRGIGIDGTTDAMNCAVPAEWVRAKLGGEFVARWKSD